MKTFSPAARVCQSFATLRSGAPIAGAVLAGAALVCSAISSGCAQKGTAAPQETVPTVVSTAAPAAARVSDPHYDPTALALAEIATHKVKPHDWPMWGG